MSRRNLKASSARPSQTPLEGRADDASGSILNPVAHPFAAFHADGASESVVRGTLATVSRKGKRARGLGEECMAPAIVGGASSRALTRFAAH
jgi:hypothetical protein